MSKFATALVLLVASSAVLQAYGGIEALSLPRNDTLAAGGTCDYNLEVRTGNVDNAGTDAVLEFQFFDRGSKWSTNVWSETIDGSPGDRFEKNHVDYFSYPNVDCIDPCILSITSDGSGSYPGWFCDYVQVTISGAISKTIIFKVFQWIDRDTMGYVNQCAQALVSAS